MRDYQAAIALALISSGLRAFRKKLPFPQKSLVGDAISIVSQTEKIGLTGYP